MKAITVFTFILIRASVISNAQTSPPSENVSYRLTESNEISSLSDTLTFTPFIAGTIMTTQYLNKGVVFSGFNGSADPLVYDYGMGSIPYGRVLISDTWYSALRMNFVDTLNAAQYHLAEKIEFDNVVDSNTTNNGEVDYMSIDAYDSMDVLIYHYLSASPEHVVLNFGVPSVAYITIDDSANTAFVADNIIVDFGNSTSVNEISPNDYRIYPNPFLNKLNVSVEENEQSEIILYDIVSGKLLQQKFKNSVTLNTEQLAKGIYIYEVSNKNSVIKKGKVVKD